MKFKLGLAQIDSVLGDLPANLQRHLGQIAEAKSAGVDLLVFPELSLTGYSLQDLTYEVAVKPEPSDPVFKPLFDASHDLDLVVSFVEEDRRHRFYVTAAYLSGGHVLHLHRKVYLPTYTLFDEKRFFAEGSEVRAFDTRFGRVGMLICEDFWHVSMPYLLWMDGADIMLLMSAGPVRGLDAGAKMATSRWTEHVIQAYAGLFTSFVAHVNRVGFEDGLVFGGGSLVFDPAGEPIAQSPYFENDLLVVPLDTGALRRARLSLPLLRDERAALTLRELTRIVNEKERG